MFTNILLPIDMTHKHQRALEIAAELARPAEGIVILLHVIEPIPGLSGEEDREFYDRLDFQAKEHLRELGQQLADRNVSWKKQVLFGHRVSEVIRFAQENSSDLIILSSPPMDVPQRELGMGSLSFKVGVLAPCPVLLVK